MGGLAFYVTNTTNPGYPICSIGIFLISYLFLLRNKELTTARELNIGY